MSTEALTPDDLTAAREELVRRKLAEIREGAVNDLFAIRAELQRRQWRDNGPLWAEERLGDFLWSMQREVMLAVRKYRKVAVASCHDVGKSRIASVIAAWWLDVFPPGEAFVVTTAPTTAQVKSILWREIGRAHVRGKLAGRVNQTEWYLPVNGREEIVAFGRKPDEYDPAAFQGIHSQNVLVIIDEANGVRGPLHDAADSLIANDSGKMLMIGNPDDPSGEFYEACKPGSGWYVIKISAFDSPNFTGEPVPPRVVSALIGKTYVEERRRKWAPAWVWSEDGRSVVPPPNVKREDSHPFWQSKILGEFPATPQGVHTLIPLPWIRAAQEKTLTLRDSDPVELGCDVGGGGDSTTISMRKGGFVRILRETRNPDTMQAVSDLRDFIDQFKASSAKVDVIGIGRGVVDRLKEINEHRKTQTPPLPPYPVVGVNVGRVSQEPDRFMNLRAQFWWYVRGLFELNQIDIDPEDEDLAAELASLRYKPGDKGKIIMESKDDARRRGVPSPNRADALMLALTDSTVAAEVTSSTIAAITSVNDTLHSESRWGFAR